MAEATVITAPSPLRQPLIYCRVTVAFRQRIGRSEKSRLLTLRVALRSHARPTFCTAMYSETCM